VAPIARAPSELSPSETSGGADGRTRSATRNDLGRGARAWHGQQSLASERTPARLVGRGRTRPGRASPHGRPRSPRPDDPAAGAGWRNGPFARAQPGAPSPDQARPLLLCQLHRLCGGVLSWMDAGSYASCLSEIMSFAQRRWGRGVGAEGGGPLEVEHCYVTLASALRHDISSFFLLLGFPHLVYSAVGPSGPWSACYLSKQFVVVRISKNLYCSELASMYVRLSCVCVCQG
jgi:hypothetical protein